MTVTDQAEPLDELIRLLDLESIELDIFRGNSPDERMQRVFGGQVAGQALIAAGRTVPPERQVHSLHAYFLRPGDPAVPIVYEVDRIRDGRSFTTRRVVAVQHGRPIFNLSASFQISEPGLEHQVGMPAAPDPETLPTLSERVISLGLDESHRLARPRPIDLRYVDDPPWWPLDRRSGEPSQTHLVWLRTDGRLPDDPLLHVCAAAYASDLTLLDAVMIANRVVWDGGRSVQLASLDHAMWFHRPFRADDWLLYVQTSPSSYGARGLGQGQLWTRDGRLVVSVVQEGLVRISEPEQEKSHG